MKKFQLQSYQINAINAIQEAVERNQKHIIVNIPAGCGKGIVLARTVDLLCQQESGDILIITDRALRKKQIENALFKEYQHDRSRITVEVTQRILEEKDKVQFDYPFLVLFDVNTSEIIYDKLSCGKKTVIIFSENTLEDLHEFFSQNDVVFSYSYKEAVANGQLTPAMDANAFEPAVEMFCNNLLVQFGYTPIESHCCEKGDSWDLVVCKSSRKIWVEWKTYKSQVISPSAANSILTTVVLKKMKQAIPDEDSILLIVLSKVPSFQKGEIFKRHKIVVWDIENLVFYCKHNLVLLKQLSQITYFPIDYVEGESSAEAESIGLSLKNMADEIVCDAETEDNKTTELLRRLEECTPGKEYSSAFEDICEEILRYLFEANYFNRLTRQHKTNDEHFRMDLIGALKTNQRVEESVHPLWQMLVQHYNSHFVVFEFKNYSEEIDQNLIYITEKYLFDAALRKVAFIISRKGFLTAAKFAAEGCLKEHGKLILDVTKDDLSTMLELKSDGAADYLLDKLEGFLMGISK